MGAAEDMERQRPNVERMHLLGGGGAARRVRHEDAQGGDERGDPRLDRQRRDNPLHDRVLRRPASVPGARPRPPGRDRARGADADPRSRRTFARTLRLRAGGGSECDRLSAASSTAPRCGSSASRPMTRRASATAAPGCRTGRARRSSRTRTARSSTHTSCRRARLPRGLTGARLPARLWARGLRGRHRRRGARGLRAARPHRGDHPGPIEPAHASARVADLDAELILVCLSGRGDKDLGRA